MFDLFFFFKKKHFQAVKHGSSTRAPKDVEAGLAGPGCQMLQGASGCFAAALKQFQSKFQQGLVARCLTVL